MIWAAIAFLILAILAAGAVSIAWFSIHPPRLAIRKTPASFGAAFEEIEFLSRDGTRLSGWWVPAENPRAVLILCHGMASNRQQMLPWAEWLWKDGFSLLLFDFRAMGKSEGRYCTMGLNEPEDILGAVDYVKSREDSANLPLGWTAREVVLPTIPAAVPAPPSSRWRA